MNLSFLFTWFFDIYLGSKYEYSEEINGEELEEIGIEVSPNGIMWRHANFRKSMWKWILNKGTGGEINKFRIVI